MIKLADYAEAGISEYWIVNPEDETITVLKLEGSAYVAHGVFRRGDMATSSLLQPAQSIIHRTAIPLQRRLQPAPTADQTDGNEDVWEPSI